MNEHKDLSVGPIIALIVIFIVVLVAFVILPGMMQPTTDLRLGDGVFRARIAYDETDRTNGLSEVTDFDSGQALLMAFPSEDEWGIWMKDMKVPIDILWLNSDKKVIYIVKNASPDDSASRVFKPKTPAKYVVEIAAGTVDSKSIKINSAATFEINEGKIK